MFSDVLDSATYTFICGTGGILGFPFPLRPGALRGTVSALLAMIQALRLERVFIVPHDRKQKL